MDWNTTAAIKVYAVLENGKRQVYSKNISVTSRTFDITIPYNDFYRGDGQYLVTIDAGGMQDNEFFEIVGQDFAYVPVEEDLPPTIHTVVPNELYPQLMLLLLGMFAAVSVRNHLHKASRSLPLDLLAVACGIAVLAVSLVGMQSNMAAAGVVLLGAGIGAAVVKRNGSPAGVGAFE